MLFETQGFEAIQARQDSPSRNGKLLKFSLKIQIFRRKQRSCQENKWVSCGILITKKRRAQNKNYCSLDLEADEHEGTRLIDRIKKIVNQK